MRERDIVEYKTARCGSLVLRPFALPEDSFLEVSSDGNTQLLSDQEVMDAVVDLESVIDFLENAGFLVYDEVAELDGHILKGRLKGNNLGSWAISMPSHFNHISVPDACPDCHLCLTTSELRRLHILLLMWLEDRWD